MSFHDFSRAQLLALTWWSDSSPYRGRDAIICDGAVRSGKTVCMGLSFFFWAMAGFDGEKFGLCGKTVTSLRRNVVSVLLPILGEMGFACEERVSKAMVRVSYQGRSNEFYLFGGKDEGSAALIQGVTFAGVLMDEAALMPRSFVEQACARCSVEGSRLWFNCNPEGPQHWFYREWICKAKERNALYVHFRLEDNPGLSLQVVERYKRMFSGVFYQRFIRGEWVAAQGLIYDFFGEEYVKEPPTRRCERYVISCDYGTANPSSFGLWGLLDGVWYRLREYYFDSRREGRQQTDGEYVDALLSLAGGEEIDCVVVDPSAASFMEALRRRGVPVVKARNDVLSGIRLTAELLKRGRMVICRGCKDAIREFALYCWQETELGREAPRKENDHAMDEIRYFAATIAGGEEPASVMAVTVER
jgi:PBSX family phage terminase large subunit